MAAALDVADNTSDAPSPQITEAGHAISDDMSLRHIFTLLKRDPTGKGINCLGYDGVLRTFDRDRNVVDAVGLNPVQVREYYEGVPLPPRLVTADGRGKSRWDKFHPDAENVPRKFTEKDRAEMRAHNKEMERRGFTCGNPRVDKGGDES